jgi:hypothetical protein
VLEALGEAGSSVSVHGTQRQVAAPALVAGD